MSEKEEKRPITKEECEEFMKYAENEFSQLLSATHLAFPHFVMITANNFIMSMLFSFYVNGLASGRNMDIKDMALLMAGKEGVAFMNRKGEVINGATAGKTTTH